MSEELKNGQEPNEQDQKIPEVEEQKPRLQWSNVFTDYYKVNRELHKQDQERYARQKAEGKKEPWTKREIIMLIICILCGIGIVLRWLLCKDC